MDNKQAIKILEEQRDYDIFTRTEYRQQVHDALDCGIKALQVQADGEYILKKDVMCCIGQTSVHSELARKLRELPSVAIPSAEPKWIFTSEKLPPIGEWVLVTNGKCDGKHCEVMTYHGLKTQIVHRVGEGEYEEQYHEWTSGHGDIQDSHPKAWMPLPKPYKEEDKTTSKEIVFGKKNLLPPTRRCTECKYFKSEILDSGRCKKFDDRYVDCHVHCDSWEQKE